MGGKKLGVDKGLLVIDYSTILNYDRVKEGKDEGI